MLNKSGSDNPLSAAKMGGTCFYGDGNIVKSFLPAEMLGMLDGVKEQMNIDTIKALGFAATNLDEDSLTAVSSSKYCGYPFFHTSYTNTNDTIYDTFDSSLSFRNKTSTISVNGSNMKQQAFTMASLDTVNRFLLDNAE